MGLDEGRIGHHCQSLTADKDIRYLEQVFFAVMLGSMALGTAGPQLATLAAAQGAATTLHAVIDRVSGRQMEQ